MRLMVNTEVPWLTAAEALDLMIAMAEKAGGSFIVLHIAEDDAGKDPCSFTSTTGRGRRKRNSSEVIRSDAQLHIRLLPKDVALCSPGKKKYDLRPREIRILKLSYLGYTEAVIARSLGVSHSTIKKDKAHIFDLLEVHNIQSAVKIALESGLI